MSQQLSASQLDHYWSFVQRASLLTPASDADACTHARMPRTGTHHMHHRPSPVAWALIMRTAALHSVPRPLPLSTPWLQVCDGEVDMEGLERVAAGLVAVAAPPDSATAPLPVTPPGLDASPASLVAGEATGSGSGSDLAPNTPMPQRRPRRHLVRGTSGPQCDVAVLHTGEQSTWAHGGVAVFIWAPCSLPCAVRWPCAWPCLALATQ